MIETELLIRALLCGASLAIVAGILGCLIMWQRMVYFGDALSHTALLGVAIGLITGLNITIGIVAICLVAAVLLVVFRENSSTSAQLSPNTLLGIMAHGALALGLVLIALYGRTEVDLEAYLFGDVMAVTVTDLYIILTSAALILLVLKFIWNRLLSISINAEIAEVEGLPVMRLRLIYIVMVALLVAVGIKMVGVLLITSLLIIPAAIARRFARTPEQMAMLAAIAAVVSVVVGMIVSIHHSLPTGPVIVMVAVLVFLLSQALPQR